MKRYLLILAAILSIFSCSMDADETYGDTNPNNTLSGSYAKILRVNDVIYAIDNDKLTTFKVNESGIEKIDVQEVGFNIENLYNHDNLIFIGSQSGMFIYKINSNGVPTRQSTTRYEFSSDVYPCDPVVSDGQYAYVTLNTTTNENSPCFRSVNMNQFRIYDVSDIYAPKLLSTTQLEGPKGIGFKDNYVFICDGQYGFKVLDTTDKLEPKMVNNIGGYKAFDLIVNGNKLSVIGDKQLVQYDITDVKNIVELSKIAL